MVCEKVSTCFSERYTQWRSAPVSLAEGRGAVSEYAVQCVWFDQLFSEEGLQAQEGQRLRVVSPGWWNRQAGPDFRGAQIAFNGQLYNGDVEIHVQASDWVAHGHHLDARYDDVVLHVVLEGEGAVFTSEGRRVATLALLPYLSDEMRVWLAEAPRDAVEPTLSAQYGRCVELTQERGTEVLVKALRLAAQWRMLNKSRQLRERMDRVGVDQAIYEAVMYACGFSHFKHHFIAVARQLPYERVQQLALKDPFLLEAAFLQIAGLLPDTLPEGTLVAPHYGRLRAFRRDELSGLRPLPLTWRRGGVRPSNNPERRLSGAARFFARTAQAGLATCLRHIWRGDATAIERRRAFEALFPRPVGFWANHCTWTGKQLKRPMAPIGAGRIRSIIGNVFIPAALAVARRERDRVWEEQVFSLFMHLPKEPDNQVSRVMLPRVLGAAQQVKIDFCLQQGLLQFYQDWCESNPSCQNCRLLQYLE